MATPLHVSKPDKQHKYDDAFKAEALRLAGESYSTRAAARQLGISKKELELSLVIRGGLTTIKK